LQQALGHDSPILIHVSSMLGSMEHPDIKAVIGLPWLVHAYARRRYAILFYSLLATIAASPLFAALAIDADLLELLLAANLLAAVVPVVARTGGRPLLVLLVVVLLVRCGAAWFNDSLISSLSLAMWTVVALLAAAGALRFALSATSIESEHVYAALDAYLLAGIFLGAFYWVLEHAAPGSIVVATGAVNERVSLGTAIYFSFVTLATLGYGDIVPVGEVARGVAIVEAVAGQLYLAVLIARLVSLYVLESTRGDGS
jgi:hypothetical protein